MKRKLLLAGAIVWTVIAVAMLVVFVLALTGNLNLKGLSVDVMGSNNKLVKQETYDLDGIDKLNIATASQNIIINLVSGSEMTVRQYDIDDKNLFTEEKSAGTLSVKVESRIVIGILIYYSPRLEIDLPAEYASAVNLASGSGSIKCPDAAPSWGNVNVSTGSGSLNFTEGITGANLAIATGSGTVRLGDISADSLSVSTSSGSTHAANITAKGDVILKSGSGSINVGSIYAGGLSVVSSSGTQKIGAISISGRASVVSGSGSVRIESVSTADLSISTSSGSIHCGDISADGFVNNTSGSGTQTVGLVSCERYEISGNSASLKYEGLSGRGSVTSGSGTVRCNSLDVRGDTSIKSGSGSVHLSLAADANFELDIVTGSGSIRAGDIELFYSNRSDHAFATVGSGENGTLSISTGSGSVRIGE